MHHFFGNSRCPPAQLLGFPPFFQSHIGCSRSDLAAKPRTSHPFADNSSSCIATTVIELPEPAFLSLSSGRPYGKRRSLRLAWQEQKGTSSSFWPRRVQDTNLTRFGTTKSRTILLSLEIHTMARKQKPRKLAEAWISRPENHEWNDKAFRDNRVGSWEEKQRANVSNSLYGMDCPKRNGKRGLAFPFTIASITTIRSTL